MKAAVFDYFKPQSLQEAIGFLDQHGDAAQVMAGGQSLLAMMNLRLAAPQWLMDISGLTELTGIESSGDIVRTGALVTHSQLLASELVARELPLLHRAVPHVAHLAIRNRGTVGGSLALGDPAAEYPAVALASEAVLVLQGPQGQRRVKAVDFYQGLYANDRQPNELVVCIEWPRLRTQERVGFDELSRRRGDYAVVGVAARLALQGQQVSAAHVAFFSVGDTALLAKQAMAALSGQPLNAQTIAQAQQALSHDLPAQGDVHADAATKQHLAKVLLGRVLSSMAETGGAA
jgi:carbon-monoxide dehydrogenase medium subunit